MKTKSLSLHLLAAATLMGMASPLRAQVELHPTVRCHSPGRADNGWEIEIGRGGYVGLPYAVVKQDRWAGPIVVARYELQRSAMKPYPQEVYRDAKSNGARFLLIRTADGPKLSVFHAKFVAETESHGRIGGRLACWSLIPAR